MCDCRLGSDLRIPRDDICRNGQRGKGEKEMPLCLLSVSQCVNRSNRTKYPTGTRLWRSSRIGWPRDGADVVNSREAGLYIFWIAASRPFPWAQSWFSCCVRFHDSTQVEILAQLLSTSSSFSLFNSTTASSSKDSRASSNKTPKISASRFSCNFDSGYPL